MPSQCYISAEDYEEAALGEIDDEFHNISAWFTENASQFCKQGERYIVHPALLTKAITERYYAGARYLLESDMVPTAKDLELLSESKNAVLARLFYEHSYIDATDYNTIIIEGQRLVDRYQRDEEEDYQGDDDSDDDDDDTTSMYIPSTMHLKRHKLITHGVAIAAISCVAVIIAINAETIMAAISAYM